jgi:hypothetical protein
MLLLSMASDGLRDFFIVAVTGARREKYKQADGEGAYSAAFQPAKEWFRPLTDGPRPANVTNPGEDPHETQDHEPLRGAAIFMKAPPGPVRMPGKAKPKAKGTSRASKPRKSATKSKSSQKARAKAKNVAVLLSGGNPQIAKADGDAPVQAYIAAMPGWKRDLGKRLDALIVRNVPDVRKAVKWNSPFYGVEGRGWFLSFHVFTRYVKVTFFAGTALRPVPPGASKH